jgi:hypothetical protein
MKDGKPGQVALHNPGLSRCSKKTGAVRKNETNEEKPAHPVRRTIARAPDGFNQILDAAAKKGLRIFF